LLFSVSPHAHIFPREINSFQPVSPIHYENVIFSMVMARDVGGRHSNVQEAENALADKWNVKMEDGSQGKSRKMAFHQRHHSQRYVSHFQQVKGRKE
jgi:hypothetical protein